MEALKEICDKAKAQNIDVTGCRYGLHSRTKTDIGETHYYRFLAGFSRVVQAKQILEVGTHMGGSILALHRGAVVGATIVTIDIKHHAVPALDAVPEIIRLTGDSLRSSTSVSAASHFAPPIDIMYIDSLHTYDAVMANISAYAHLRPRFIIFDDIKINPTMEKMWAELCAKWPSCDVSDIADRKRVGFGVVAPIWS